MTFPQSSAWQAKIRANGDWSCLETTAILITCSLTDGEIVAAGQSSFGANLAVELAANAADFGTVVTASSSERPDPDSNNNVATATTSVVVLAEEANLSISASDVPDSVAAGAPLMLQVTVANEGPRAVSQATVAISLPLEFTSGVELKGGSGRSCSEDSTGMISCTLSAGSIDAASRSSFGIPLTVAGNALIGNAQTTMNVQSSHWTDPEPDNNMTPVTTTITGGKPSTLMFADGFEQ